MRGSCLRWTFRSGYRFVVALGVTTCHGAIACAQTAAAQPGEIVVTAEKRDATVQKTPISITALRGSDLVQAGITNITEIAQQVPGVSLKTGGPGQTELEMRGLNSAGGNSPTVGFYLDETPLTSFAYATAGKVVIDPDLYDLNRVEVLRGPQGTLYGSGSMGGTIRLLTNQPQLDGFHMSGELTGSVTQGGGVNGGGNAMVNLPIVTDTIALRVVGTDKYTSGWIDRIVLDPFPLPTDGGLTRGDVLSAPVAKKTDDVNHTHLEAVRASLLIKPTDRLSITPMAMGQRINSGGQWLVDVPPAKEAHYQPFDTPEPVKDRFWLASLSVKYDFDDFQIVSATSHWHRSLVQVQDGSEVMQDVLGLPSYYVDEGGLGYDPWTERDTATETSEELRIASTGTSRFQWLAGGFYGDLRSTTLQYSDDAAAGDLFGVTTLYHEYVPQAFKQLAGFGEASYQITQTLKATAGLRYFHFHNKFATSEYGFFGPNGDDTPGGSASTEKDSGVNPKFNLAWLPSRDFTLYGIVSKGFRPGGGNQIIPTSGTEEGDACAASLASFGKTDNPTTYKPDSVWNYEIGEKARFLNGALTVNASAYYENWRNIQRAVTLTCGYIYSDNAGSAHVYGAELEVSAKLGKELTFTANGAYTHAVYAQDSAEAGVSKGDRLPDVPRFTSSQSIVWEHPLSDRYAIVGRLQNNYISSREDLTYYVARLPRYDIASGRLGLTSKAGWQAFFYVDNLTDKHALISAINSQVLNIPTMTRDTTNQPRTFGIDLTYAM